MSVGRNTLSNLIGAVVPMFVTLATVPLYLKTLGDVRYGVLALVWLVLGYFSFLELGLGRSTANHIARLSRAPARLRAETFWTAIAVNLAVGLLGALCLGVSGSYMASHASRVPSEYRAEIIGALPWIVSTLPVVLVSSVLNGALEGRERFRTVNGLQVAGTILFQVVPLGVALWLGPNLGVVIPAAVITRASMNVPVFVACARHIPLVGRPSVSWASTRSLLSFGGWVAVTSVLHPLLETFDRLLIGAMLGAQSVTHYSVPFQLVTKVRIIPTSLARALFPRISANDEGGSLLFAQRSILSLVVVMTPVIVLGIILLEPFLLLWVGAPLASVASPVGEALLVGILVNSVAHVPFTLLQARGHPGTVARLHVVEVIPFLLVLWGAISAWGLRGAAWAWTARVTVDAILLLWSSGMLRTAVPSMIAPLGLVLAVAWIARVTPVASTLGRALLLAGSMVSVAAWLRFSSVRTVVAELAAFVSARTASAD